ncbi:hypothetical protein R3P38DRAFT_3227150 [Favolaschia claudopus]|uniref:Uncharacterized protein n=1 Tax=Favolaschia claudopus TaxID=2862362 RepID=A0AAV9ZSR4_9AGAR
MYAVSGGRALAEALDSAADLIPLPFLSAFVDIAIKVLEACEEATAIEEDLMDLQGRVYDLMLAVVHTVPVNRNASIALQDKVRRLQLILDGILSDVAKINAQKKWLLLFFHSLNKDRVDRCVSRLNAALEQFTVVNQIQVEDLLDKIRADYSAFGAQLNRIEDAVNRTTQPHNAPSAHPRQDMPPPSRRLFGREALIDEIASLLSVESTSRASQELKEYIFWIPCIEAKSSDLFRRILYAQLRVTAETYDSLETLLEELDANKERRLLLLDNFETPWLSGQDREEVVHILARLAALPHIALLVTMSSGFTPGDIEWQHRPLAPLDPSAARDAFKAKYRDAAGGDQLAEDQRELDEFLASIGHMPLAITLAAAIGGRLRVSPAELLRDWRTAGIGIMSGHETLSMDETIRVSMERGVVRSNPDAMKILAVLSMLPAGTNGDNLRWWAPSVASPFAAVQTLRAAALVEQGDGPFAGSRIFVRPTILSYMSQQNRISVEIRNQVHDACYAFVLRHKSIPDERKFKADLAALAAEESNIQGLLTDTELPDLRPNVIDALIAFGFYPSWTKASTAVASRALKIAQAARDAIAAVNGTDMSAAARRVAEAHQCLAASYSTLSQYKKASRHFEQASVCFKSLPEGADLRSSGECSMQSLRMWRLMKTPKSGESLEPLVKTTQTDLSHDPVKKYHVALGLLCLGEFQWWLRRGDEALETLGSAKTIFDQLDCPASAAECLYYIARSHMRRNEPSEALQVARDALTRAEESGELGLLCRILGINARYLMILELHDDALSMITRYLAAGQSVGFPIGIAQSLELLAYNCAARMDISGARVAYEAAQAQFRKRGSTRPGRRGVARCTENVERLRVLPELNQDSFATVSKPVPWC